MTQVLDLESVDPDRLLESVRAGDKVAFAELYDVLAPQILGLTTHILRDRAQAEEVTQEVFVEVWLSAHTFDPHRGSAKSWVLRLAKSRAIDRLRSWRSSQARDTDDFNSQLTTWVAAAEDEAQQRLESEELQELIDSIGEPHRSALMLAYFGELTHQEIADATGVALGTAKTRVRDGLQKLRKAVSLKGGL
ncbi:MULTISPECIES: sigma-70 family RNA polymerase sigma factor [Corynebacterium]|uniref:Sigma-70 family RNA polymerase sigma factor n=1 Tax=Corynebacterium pseudogenitalium TaxID=38303 RepID=A0ABD4TQY4_9CORY|nr:MULTISPECIES: sigma-70 family RNA polymerase sigma factor [Corynebacterium]MCQ4613685.1 sigma-70 family RNA polymerase sigma factor [Corynebacterium pseudogenitalium]MDK8244437.1 sigma-70 family RNA polymerase sigma factor [Corynebacterium sp. UMB10321]UUA88051.1 sigma-70 family RNA polymerase sigma factor [Corynebacterium pseudogenitalium]